MNEATGDRAAETPYPGWGGDHRPFLPDLVGVTLVVSIISSLGAPLLPSVAEPSSPTPESPRHSVDP